MDAILNWLWQGCVLALVTACMLRVLERSRAQSRYVLCWAALLSVLVLPFVPLTTGALSPLAFSARAAAPQSRGVVPMPDAWWTSSALALAACALWSLVSGVRLAVATLALGRARRRCRALSPMLETTLRQWTGVTRQGRRTRLMLSDNVRAAAVLGCRSPIIAVAPAVVQHLSADELDRVVIHEWAHIRRGDHFANVLQLLTRVVAGWHPAVCWIDRRLQLEREVACDEMTVAVTGDARLYAASLVKLASLPRGYLAALPALGVLSSPALATRIRRIVSQRSLASAAWSRSAVTASIVLLVMLSLTIGTIRIVETALVSADFDRAAAVAALQPNDASKLVSRRPIVQPANTDGPAERASRQASPSVDVSPGRTATRTRAAAASDTTAAPIAATVAADSSRLVSSAPPYDTETLIAAPIESHHADLATSVTAAPAAQLATNVRQPLAPWDTAANGGAAIGEGSKKAAIATAGLFTRFGKRIAGSF